MVAALSLTGYAATAAVPTKAGLPSSQVNGRIAFATEGDHSQIYTVNPDGSDQRQLTHASNGVQVDAPDWSPDGSQIAYSSDASGFGDVWVMNANGSNQRAIAHTEGWDYYQPRWSPDGSQFAVVRCNRQFGFCNIDLMNSDGTGRRILVGSHVANFDPSWSPDGHEIVFASDRANLVAAIWVIDLADHTLRRLTRPALEACYPSWSPLGNRILFTGGCGHANPHSYVMNPDGTHVRRISPEPSNKSAAFGSYSPDGRHIVLVSDVLVGLGADLFTMNGNGTGMTPIVTNHRHVFFADWGTHPTTDAGTS
ncbi:MAG: TolB protein [Nocardioidaceae bacterium]|jgi:TolB protein|nr:TolB protein [Nocardioidaceae bacterium]